MNAAALLAEHSGRHRRQLLHAAPHVQSSHPAGDDDESRRAEVGSYTTLNAPPEESAAANRSAAPSTGPVATTRGPGHGANAATAASTSATAVPAAASTASMTATSVSRATAAANVDATNAAAPGRLNACKLKLTCTPIVLGMASTKSSVSTHGIAGFLRRLHLGRRQLHRHRQRRGYLTRVDAIAGQPVTGEGLHDRPRNRRKLRAGLHTEEPLRDRVARDTERGTVEG